MSARERDDEGTGGPVPVVVDHVTHRYPAADGGPGRLVLDDVSVRLDERRVGIVGANGSGKSTFARLLNGLVVPSEGTVTVDGLDTAREGAAVRRRVGFCFTDPDAQIVMPTVREDLAFGLRQQRTGRLGRPVHTRDEVAARVDEALDRFDLAGHADHPAHLLSGGQKQLLAVAAVMVTRPRVLVLDEPTTLLDLRNTRRVASLLSSLDVQVVLVTHDLDLLDDYDRVLVFDRARLVHDGPPGEAVTAYRRLMEARP